MRYFLLLLLSCSVIHYSSCQISFPFNGDISDDVFKCDSTLAHKSNAPGEKSYKNIYQYYPDGSLKTDIGYNLNNNTWEPQEKYEYVYEKGKLFSLARASYNRYTAAWSSDKIQYYYGLDGNLIEKTTARFEQNTNSWTPSSIEEFVYSNNGKIVTATTSIYLPTGLEKNLKVVTYLNRFNLLDSLIQSIYIEGVLTTSKKELYTYDSDGYMKSAVRINNEYGSLQITNYREVTYDSNKNPSYIDKSPLQKTSFKFEFKFDLKGNRTNTWLPLFSDDFEAYAWFRHGLITETKISFRFNETEPWVDTNEGGTIYYSRIDGLSSVRSPDINSSISIFPNPTIGVINIVHGVKDNTLQSYSLKNAQGTTIQQELLLPYQSAINISEIPTGVYILELMIGNEKYFKKVIKN